MHLQSQRLVLIFRGLRQDGEGGLCCWHIQRCFQPDTENQQCREKYVLGLPVGSNNRKIFSISLSWKGMPGAVVSESLDF